MGGDFKMWMYLVYMGPLVSALVCLIILRIGGRWEKGSPDIKLRNILTVYFSFVALNWLWTVTSIPATQFALWLRGTVYCTLLMVGVLLYHFLYVLTSDNDRPFSLWHYAFPAVAGLALTIWTAVIPREISYGIVYDTTLPGCQAPFDPQTVSESLNYRLYAVFILSISAVRLLYNTVYTLMGIMRIRRYRKRIVNFSADMENNTLGWMWLLMILALPLFLTPLMVISSQNLYVGLVEFRVAIPAVFMFFQMPVICYYTITRRYVLMDDPGDDPEIESEPAPQGVAVEKPAASRHLTPENLERYMTQEKPYLKSDMKITDMIVPFKTNRSTLSAFINNTYGINFSQYVNGYRLRELQAITANPDAKGTNMEKIRQAGFGSYHSYYRAKQQNDSRRLLLPDDE